MGDIRENFREIKENLLLSYSEIESCHLFAALGIGAIIQQKGEEICRINIWIVTN